MLRGFIYRKWSKFIHKHGYHYAPKKPPIEGTAVQYGIDGKPVRQWRYWCEWCGIRGDYIEIPDERKE